MNSDKKWVFIGFGLGAVGVALFSSFRPRPQRGDGATNSKNMNKGKTDRKENRSGATYAMFNLNPLNVKVGKTRYPNEITTDGAMHRMFDSWTAGTAAGMIHLWRYLNGKITGDVYPTGTRLNTIEKIVRTWAPVSDPSNDTENYIQFVVRHTGIARDELIFWKQSDIVKLVAIMAVREDRPASDFVNKDVLGGAWEIAAKYVGNMKFY